jgi:hypothetical protein
MKMWKDNKITGEWELADEEIARRFLASEFGNASRYPWPLERALSAFITAGEPIGLSSVWEDRAAFDRITDLISETERTTQA